jgi:hypothetical protein
MSDLALILIAGLGVVLLFALIRSRKRPRKARTGVGSFGWALLFLSSGRMPPPPPQSQIEQEANVKKNRDASRSGES